MFLKKIDCKSCDLIKMYNEIVEENNEYININKFNIKKCDSLFKKYKEGLIEIKRLKDDNIIKDTEIIELKQKNKELDHNELANILTIESFILQNDDLEEKIFALKEMLGHENLDWHIERNMAWRWGLDKLKPEKYEIPINFDVGRVKFIDFDDSFQMVSFNHEDDFGEDKFYKIPISLYEILGGKLFKGVKEKKMALHITKVIPIDEIKKILISTGWNLRGKYIGKMLIFIKDYFGKTFLTKDFNDFCGFENRETRSQYLKKLIISGLVKKVKNGVYEVIPLEI